MKRKLIAVALLATLSFSVACSTAWLTTFDGYLKIAGPILIQILDIVSIAKGVPVNQAMVAKINADQAALNSLADSITTATAADLPNTCAAFNQAVATFSADLTAIEQLANVGPNTSGEIGAAVGIAQAAIQEIEAPIQACQSAPNARVARERLQNAALTVKSPNDVVKRFNSVVDAKHHVHIHALPLRVLSFGKLQ